MMITRDQAHRAAIKLFGKNAEVEYDPRAMDAEERAPFEARLREVREQIKALKAEADILFSKTARRRCRVFRVDRISGLERIGVAGFRHQLASGDTWEECLTQSKEVKQ